MKAPRLLEVAERKQAASGGEDDRIAFLDAQRILTNLPEHDREMFIAVALGDDRDEVARRFATSRANVDQKISRLRKRFQKGES